MKKTAFIIIFNIFLCLPSYSADSVPPLINYQGMLTDANGSPMTGTRKLTFNIYDAAAGGNVVWGPQIFDSVPLIEGKFNVILGTTDTAGKPISGAFVAKERYIGIKVDENSEIAPRQQVLSAPFAIQSSKAAEADHANKADHATEADEAKTVRGTNLSVDPDSGNVSILKNLTITGGIQTENNKPAFFVNVASDDCNWGHPYLGCPEGYIMAGRWHVGPGGGACDIWIRGAAYENGSIGSGWMCLCVAESIAETDVKK